VIIFFFFLLQATVAYIDSDCWLTGTTSKLIASKTGPTRAASASGGKKKDILHQFSGFTGRWYTDKEVRDTEDGKEGVEEKGAQGASGEGTDIEGKAGRTGEARSVSGAKAGLGLGHVRGCNAKPRVGPHAVGHDLTPE
jgi:hypothetical protein